MNPTTGTTAASPGPNLTLADLERVQQDIARIERESTIYVDIYCSEVVDRGYVMAQKMPGLTRHPDCPSDKQWLAMVVPKKDCDRWIAVAQEPYIVLRVFGREEKRT
jgi:hypothetical protein